VLLMSSSSQRTEYLGHITARTSRLIEYACKPQDYKDLLLLLQLVLLFNRLVFVVTDKWLKGNILTSVLKSKHCRLRV
jgi:hypothetical protein